jgi:hypothetical protein
MLNRSLKEQLSELEERVQGIVPDHLKPVSPKEGYKKPPKDTTGMVLRKFYEERGNGRCKCFKVRKKNFEYWVSLDAAIVDEEKGTVRCPDPDCDVCGGKGVISSESGWVERWAKLQPFNLKSPDQMKKYAIFHGHAIPKDKKGKRLWIRWQCRKWQRITKTRCT